jgi:hypothetical protein
MDLIVKLEIKTNSWFYKSISDSEKTQFNLGPYLKMSDLDLIKTKSYFSLNWTGQTPSDSHHAFIFHMTLATRTAQKPWKKDGSSGSRPPTVLQFGRGFFLRHHNDETQPFY